MTPLRWTRLLIWLLAPAAPAQLTHTNSQACCLVPDPQGNLYVIGTANANISITKLNPAHQIVTTFEFGGGSLDLPVAATLDPQRQSNNRRRNQLPRFPPSPRPRTNRPRLPRRLFHPGQPRHRRRPTRQMGPSPLPPSSRSPNRACPSLCSTRILPSKSSTNGYAPGLVVNLLQISLRLPSSSGSYFQLMIGSKISAQFSLYL